MKPSKYNMLWEVDDQTSIAFNSMTCALAEVDHTFTDMLKKIENVSYENLSKEEQQLVDQMLHGNFIVKDCVDELKMVKYRHLNGKFSSDSMGFVIAPTLKCNFACPYCYEEDKMGRMSEEVQQSVLDYVKEAAEKRKPVSITWYGGEPLVAQDIVFGMSEKMIEMCEENKTPYSAFMVTNGYLVDEEVIDNMKKYKINGCQITIDGPPDIHNERRKLKGSPAPTFDRIVENVIKLKDAGIRTNVRVNVDRTNVDRVEELLTILEEKNLQDVAISLGHVTAYTDACQSVVENCMNTEEYAKESLKYQEILHSRGFHADHYPHYPGIKANYCCADSISSYVLDPQGHMYKCWNDVGVLDRTVGQITKIKEVPDEQMYMRNIDYIFWSPFEYEECRDCNILPICMGGCPYNGEKADGKPECEKWRYNLEEVLRKTYTQRIQNMSECEPGCACS